MKVIKEGDLEEIEETFYEQTVSSEDLEDIKVDPKIENLHKKIKEELGTDRGRKMCQKSSRGKWR